MSHGVSLWNLNGVVSMREEMLVFAVYAKAIGADGYGLTIDIGDVPLDVARKIAREVGERFDEAAENVEETE